MEERRTGMGGGQGWSLPSSSESWAKTNHTELRSPNSWHWNMRLFRFQNKQPSLHGQGASENDKLPTSLSLASETECQAHPEIPAGITLLWPDCWLILRREWNTPRFFPGVLGSFSTYFNLWFGPYAYKQFKGLEPSQAILKGKSWCQVPSGAAVQTDGRSGSSVGFQWFLASASINVMRSLQKAAVNSQKSAKVPKWKGLFLALSEITLITWRIIQSQKNDS